MPDDADIMDHESPTTDCDEQHEETSPALLEPTPAEQEAPTLRRRRHRRTQSGPSFTLPKKTSLHKSSSRRRRLLSDDDRRSFDVQSDDGEYVRSRDLSPVMVQMRGYLEEADDLLEEVLESIVHKAENASAAVVHNLHRSKDVMKSGVHQASEIVHSGVYKASEIAHSGVHQASEIVHRSKDVMKSGVHQAEELAKEVYDRLRSWKACHHEKLPNWLKDNEHLHFGHRPEIPSFAECFRSIFRIHTETGNIWTHLIGFVAFVIVTIIFYVQPLCATCKLDIDLSEKLIFLCFFIGAILCLACSTLFHTVSCHSEVVSAIFSRLDYAGIAFLIVGSIIPWLYYGFYCQFYAKLTYIVAVSLLGVLTIVLTMWERFNLPDYRVYRTLVFVSLGFVSVVPCVHYVVQNGLDNSVMEASMHCTVIMGALYLTGATLYATRIPERFMPGKCDIWFQSHQIFHVLVIVAAFVHYHGISEMAMYRLKHDSQCIDYMKAQQESYPEIYVGSVY